MEHPALQDVSWSSAAPWVLSHVSVLSICPVYPLKFFVVPLAATEKGKLRDAFITTLTKRRLGS